MFAIHHSQDDNAYNSTLLVKLGQRQHQVYNRWTVEKTRQPSVQVHQLYMIFFFNLHSGTRATGYEFGPFRKALKVGFFFSPRVERLYPKRYFAQGEPARVVSLLACSFDSLGGFSNNAPLAPLSPLSNLLGVVYYLFSTSTASAAVSTGHFRFSRPCAIPPSSLQIVRSQRRSSNSSTIPPPPFSTRSGFFFYGLMCRSFESLGTSIFFEDSLT